MRKITLIFICLALSVNLTAQDLFQFKFFPSVHIGFFYPDDVNSYIANDLSGYIITQGTSDLILNINLGMGFGFRFANLFEIQPIVEYSIAPKIIINIDKSYSFNKFSGGIMANFLIPVASNRKHSIIIGGGMFYHNMTFEKFSGNTIDPRFQAGFSINNNRFNPQIILSVDLAKTEADNNEYFELDYTSVRIGVNLNL